MACAHCWEAVIRADERVVVLFELEDTEAVPADDIDEIAVELAVAGKRVNDGPVPLTPAERIKVVARLTEQGLGPRRSPTAWAPARPSWPGR